MKKIICLLLIAALLGFLVVSNPTTEEFSRWYARQCYPEESVGALDQLAESFTQYLAQGAVRDNYLVCSVYTYDGHTTLGIALRFVPVDALSEQIADLREGYAAWLEETTAQTLPDAG